MYDGVEITATDYYPFGLEMPGRTFQATSYRYGFNGKENDRTSWSATQLVQDYGNRLYNPAIGKFLSVDPITSKYPELTPYQFASNRPMDGIDLDGLEWYPKPDNSGYQWEGFPTKPKNNEGAVYRSKPYAVFPYKQGADNYTKVYLTKIIDKGNKTYDGAPIEKTIKGTLTSKELKKGDVHKISGLGELKIVDYGKQINTEYNGSKLLLQFKNEDKNKSYEWVQIVQGDGSGFTGNFYDGFDFPFYMPENSKQIKGGFPFQDTPGTLKGRGNDDFKATLILYERDGKELTPKLIISWGHKVSNGKTTLKPLTLTKVTK